MKGLNTFIGNEVAEKKQCADLVENLNVHVVEDVTGRAAKMSFGTFEAGISNLKWLKCLFFGFHWPKHVCSKAETCHQC